jgi:asparagine synthase (glutamine-hydrolysing)
MTGICGLIGRETDDLESKAKILLSEMKIRGQESTVFSQTLPERDNITIGICRKAETQSFGQHAPPLILDGVFFGDDIESDAMESGPARLLQTPGAFAFLTMLKETLIAGRDIVGQKPLYFGCTTDGIISFASLRSALNSIRVADPRPVPPGKVVSCLPNGTMSMKDFSLRQPEEHSISEPEAIEKLDDIFSEAVERVLPRGSGVAFSGGLDSGLVASAAKTKGLDPDLISVGLKGQEELTHAREIARELGLHISVRELSDRDVLNSVSDVARVVETDDPTIIGISIPIYFACEKAREMGLNYLAAGQLSDELFGGYGKFEDIALRNGTNNLGREMFESVIAASANDFDPGDKLAVAAGLELCCPFGYLPLVEYALMLPASLRVRLSNGRVIRKYILRRLAARLNLPQSVVDRPKKAIQYSSGVQKVLLREAKRRRMTLTKMLESPMD